MKKCKHCGLPLVKPDPLAQFCSERCALLRIEEQRKELATLKGDSKGR